MLVVPHLELIVRPLAFEAERIDYGRLSSVAQEITVRMRGWPLPFIQHPSNGDDWVGEVHEGSESESWRLHDSGLFLHAQAIPTHFQSEWRQAGDQPPATFNFPMWLPAAFLTEAFTLAAGLQRILDPDAPIQVAVAAEGVQGAMLVAANPHRAGFHARYVFGSPGGGAPSRSLPRTHSPASAISQPTTPRTCCSASAGTAPRLRWCAGCKRRSSAPVSEAWKGGTSLLPSAPAGGFRLLPTGAGHLPPSGPTTGARSALTCRRHRASTRSHQTIHGPFLVKRGATAGGLHCRRKKRNVLRLRRSRRR